MKCPNDSCQSENLHAERKYKSTNTLARKKWTGRNIDRRRYKCLDCNSTFYTVEMPEIIYEQTAYSNVPGRTLDSRIR